MARNGISGGVGRCGARVARTICWWRAGGVSAGLTRGSRTREIAWALAESAGGPYLMQGTVLGPRDGDFRDSSSLHKPMLLLHQGRYLGLHGQSRPPAISPPAMQEHGEENVSYNVQVPLIKYQKVDGGTSRRGTAVSRKSSV